MEDSTLAQFHRPGRRRLDGIHQGGPQTAAFQCLQSRDCGQGKLCQNNSCQAQPGCSRDTDCTNPSLPVCDTSQRACVQCLQGSDCKDGAKPIFNAPAGSIRAEGSLREGSSRIRCEMGSVRVALAPDSDVRVSVLANMGKVNLDDGTETRGGARRWGEREEAVFGSGTASLDIESQMGSVTVSRSQ